MEELRKTISNAANPNEIKDGITLLHTAIKLGDSESILKLIEKGANPNITESSELPPVHYCIKQHQLECLKVLLSHKADPNLALKDGTTPVFTAIQFSFNEALNELINSGADINHQRNLTLETPLLFAIHIRNSKAAEILITKGCVRTCFNNIAIIDSLKYGDIETFRVIMQKYPKDLLLKDENGVSVSDLAMNCIDPAFELLILTKLNTDNCNDTKFIAALKETILNDINRARKLFSQPVESFSELSEFLSNLIRIEREVVRFDEFIEAKSKLINNRLVLLNGTHEKSPLKDNIKELENSWESKIRESEQLYTSFLGTVHTPESKAAIKRWSQYVQTRSQFFLHIMNESKYIIGDQEFIKSETTNCNNILNELTSVKNWHQSQTTVFQSEIVTFTRKVRIAIHNHQILNSPEEILGKVQILNTQINKTNPDLFSH